MLRVTALRHMDAEGPLVDVVKLVTFMGKVIVVIVGGSLVLVVRNLVLHVFRRLNELERRIETQATHQHEPYDDGEVWDNVSDLELRLEAAEICGDHLNWRLSELESRIGVLGVQVSGVLGFQASPQHEPYDDAELWANAHVLELRLETAENTDDHLNRRLDELEQRIARVAEMAERAATDATVRPIAQTIGLVQRGPTTYNNLAPRLESSTVNPWRRTTTDEEDAINQRLQDVMYGSPWQDMVDAHNAAHPEMLLPPPTGPVWL